MKKISCLLSVVFLLSFTVTGCATSPPKTVNQKVIQGIAGPPDAEQQTIYQTFVSADALNNKTTSKPLPTVVQNTGSTTKVLASSASMAANNLPRLTAKDVQFDDNWKDIYKPEGSLAAKFYLGKPQIKCYNDLTRNDIPEGMLNDMLDYLSANQPLTAAEKSNQNHAYKPYNIHGYKPNGAMPMSATTTVFEERKTLAASAPTVAAEKKVAAATFVETPPMTMMRTPLAAADPSAELKKQLAAKEAELAALKDAEAKRLAAAKAEADKKAKEAADAEAKRLADAKAEKAKKAAAARKAEAEKKTAVCLEGLKKIGYEGDEGIKRFQKKYALKVDGFPGDSTCSQMRAVLAACVECKDEPAATEPAPKP